MKYIIVFIESELKFKFFSKFIEPARNNNYELILLYNKYSLYKKSQTLLAKSILLKEEKIEIDLSKSLFIKALEYKLNLLNYSEANVFYKSIYTTLTKLHKLNKIEYLFLWGDTNLSEIILKQFASINSIKTIFFELSNLPNKLQVDPQGVNYNSIIINNPEILDDYSCNEKDFSDWLNKLIEYKKNSKKIPQQKNLFKINIYYLFDRLLFRILKIPKTNNYSSLKALADKISFFCFGILNFSKPLPEKFFFLPLQDSYDSQIVIHGNGFNNISAIEYVYNEARKNNCKLIIKIHPAEKNYREIISILLLCKKLGIQISKKTSTNLIHGAEKIYTINSSVGLEAKLFQKEVLFLGKSIYRDLTKQQLKKYILHYLMDLDFFNSGKISDNLLVNILHRSRLF